MEKELLSKPISGWTDVCVGENTYSLGYCTDVPVEWLCAAIYGLENLVPFAVNGFCEPGRFLCLVSYWNCHVVIEDDENLPLQEDEITRETVHLSMIKFCRMLHECISCHIDDWSRWDYDIQEHEEPPDMVIAMKKQKLEFLLGRLDTLIRKQEEHFGADRFFL